MNTQASLTYLPESNEYLYMNYQENEVLQYFARINCDLYNILKRIKTITRLTFFFVVIPSLYQF